MTQMKAGNHGIIPRKYGKMEFHTRKFFLLSLLAASVVLAMPVWPSENVHPPLPPGGGADCSNCHACANPTAASPCLKPCPTQGRTGTGAEGALPGIIILDSLARHYGAVTFKHAEHARMSMMDGGCADCHHEDTQDNPRPCRACHDNASSGTLSDEPGLRGIFHRSCLACHRDWDHENACGMCHTVARTAANAPAVPTALEQPKAVTRRSTFVYETPDVDETRVTFHHADHVEVFGLACAACHEGENCKNCHDAMASRQHLREEPHADCVHCHATQTEEDCAFCHGKEERPRFNHVTRTGFDLSRFHAGQPCSACHEAPPVFTGLVDDCGACHADDWHPEGFDHATTGRELDEIHVEADCQDCHVDGFGSKARCDTCHETADGPEPATEAGAEGES